MRFGDLQEKRNNFDTNGDEGLNKTKVGEYFRVMKELDCYIGQKDKYSITYNPRPVT